MRVCRIWRSKRATARWFVLGCLWIATGLKGGSSSGPKIEFIELFQSNSVLIHFDTEPNATYSLEYNDSVNAGGQPWSLLYVAPSLPFGNHYIIPDTRAKPRRFYRLRMTP